MNLFKNMIISALLLALFAIVGTFFVSYTFDNTIERINEMLKQRSVKEYSASPKEKLIIYSRR